MHIFNEIDELYSLFLKFSALGLLQDIRNNFHSAVASMIFGLGPSSGY